MLGAEDRHLTSLGLECYFCWYDLDCICSQVKFVFPATLWVSEGFIQMEGYNSQSFYLLYICIQLVSLETAGINAPEPASDF